MDTTRTHTTTATALLATAALFMGACGNDASAAAPPEANPDDAAAASPDPSPEPEVPYHQGLKSATAPAIGVSRVRDAAIGQLSLGDVVSGHAVAASYQTSLDAATALVPGDAGATHAAVTAFLTDAVAIGGRLDDAAADGDLDAYVASEVELHTALAETMAAVEADADVCRLVAQWAGVAPVWQQLCTAEVPYGDWGREVFAATRALIIQTVPTNPDRVGLVGPYHVPESARIGVPVATNLEQIHAFYLASQPVAMGPHDEVLQRLSELDTPTDQQPHLNAVETWLTDRRAATERLVQLASDGASFTTMATEAVAPIAQDQPGTLASILDDDDSCGIVALLYC